MASLLTSFRCSFLVKTNYNKQLIDILENKNYLHRVATLFHELSNVLDFNVINFF